MNEVVGIDVVNDVGIITIDSPPVNALSVSVRRGLDAGFRKLSGHTAARAIVLICGGRTFVAGADISELGKPFQPPGLDEVAALIENGSKPVIAAIHGTALGGGLELALFCHFRIAVPSAKLGLPEVNLGLLPGGGGTQRLPRLVGVEVALDMIAFGKPISAQKGLALGLLDAVAAEGRLREDAVSFAQTVLKDKRPLVRLRDRQDKIDEARAKPQVFDEFRKTHARAFRGFRAPENIIKSIEATVQLPFEAGLRRERELFTELREGVQSAAQRYAFFSERESAKVPDVPANTPTLPVATVGVIGAGTMGGGIAMNFLNVGLPVTIVETKQETLDRGIAIIRKNYEAAAKKGRMTEEDVRERMALLKPTLEMKDLAEADLIIEAVFENLPLKKEIFARLDRIAKPSVILASNTSFLNVNEIAAATARPEQIVGLHFFSPANVMRLLEIVRTASTSKEILATALKLAKQIGKVPVVSGVCEGFIANRAMKMRGRQADAMILEGTRPEAIDRAAYQYGFAMGPFQMIDLVGLDVIGRDSAERTVNGDLVSRGRLGQKQNGGYYDYDDRRNPTPSPLAAEVILEVARAKGITPDPTTDEGEIIARLLYPVVNEGAKILEEGIALRASDIDIAAILGYGWPVHTGGPMFWASTIGLPKVAAKLKDLQDKHGEFFRPAPLLERLAQEGKGFI
jgi:3-hydroxyacyl-CoA dehydrogenase